MAAPTAIEEPLRAAVSYLREAGHEVEARAVESLLVPGNVKRNEPLDEDDDVLSIAEAAESLGLTSDEIQQRVGLGLLTGITAANSGVPCVTRSSVDAYLASDRALARLLQLPYLTNDPANGVREDSLLGQMLLAARSTGE